MAGEAKSVKGGAPRSFLDDLLVTFSCPMAWLLVMALILTWSGVAIVLFDLLDYPTLAGLPPPSALGKKIMRSKVAAKALKASLAPVEEEGSDWLEMAWEFLASLVAPEDEEEEAILSEEL